MADIAASTEAYHGRGAPKLDQKSRFFSSLLGCFGNYIRFGAN
ncbi:MAG: hypothetical protein V4559_07905 [Pseudomonadota bacterium]